MIQHSYVIYSVNRDGSRTELDGPDKDKLKILMYTPDDIVKLAISTGSILVIAHITEEPELDITEINVTDIWTNGKWMTVNETIML